MQIYDISQEVFGCAVYPGDPEPQRQVLSSIKNGDVYNLTAFSMCAHNGTHIDAPYHFFEEGDGVDEIALEKLIGLAFVFEFEGIISNEDIRKILDRVKSECSEASKRLLIKGKATLSLDAAKILVKEGIYLFGNESQTVGDENAPMPIHKSLLGADIVLLEGIRLSDVPSGAYFLFAAPISLGGADGAPCRAVLVKQ